MIRREIVSLIQSVKEGGIGIESVKHISRGFSRGYVCRMGHIEEGDHYQICLIYFLASSNNSPGIKNPAVSFCMGSEDDEGWFFPIVELSEW